LLDGISIGSKRIKSGETSETGSREVNRDDLESDAESGEEEDEEDEGGEEEDDEDDNHEKDVRNSKDDDETEDEDEEEEDGDEDEDETVSDAKYYNRVQESSKINSSEIDSKSFPLFIL
jgi:hypothetical protein